MIYSNYDFLLLLPPLLVWFYQLRRAWAQNLLLLAASTLFLAWTNPWNLLPAVVVLVVVYGWFALDARYRLGWRGAGLVIGLLVLQLAYLKYRGFIADTFGVALPVPGALALLLPLGLSFYSFEAISAIIDIRRRRAPVPAMSWALFIMFLPHLLAGPIVRWRLLSPQFSDAKRFRWRNLSVGMHLFTIGFLKKLAADPLGEIIDPTWAAPGQASGAALLLALLGFSAQLYLDFSGYTDMGRGIARMLGFRLPLNFRAPFFAHNPADFYQRWHVSLSSWIRTFVYDTLAVAVFRRVRGRKRQNRALFAVILVVMALFGLWHGGAWHFVLFGVAQGLVIAGWAMVTRGRAPRSRLGCLAGLLVLQATWLASLLLFRADSLAAIGQFLGGLFRGGLGGAGWSDPALPWCLVAMTATLLVQTVDYFVRHRPVARVLGAVRGTALGAGAVAMVFAGALTLKISLDAARIAAAGSTGAPSAGFIYFRF
jgi:D-alanyl-lipoteichoic acid acyltransferase DltB (MBOAT superfamily)